MTNTSNAVPPIEAVIGHWFALGEVHIVFAEADGRQFILDKETLDRSFGDYLASGQTWGRREGAFPLAGGANEEEKMRAYHEAGHAVVCIDEGIKVEFVTIIPSKGRHDEVRLGFCQYDGSGRRAYAFRGVV
jgi:hypothetical protein